MTARSFEQNVRTGQNNVAAGCHENSFLSQRHTFHRPLRAPIWKCLLLTGLCCTHHAKLFDLLSTIHCKMEMGWSRPPAKNVSTSDLLPFNTAVTVLVYRLACDWIALFIEMN